MKFLFFKWVASWVSLFCEVISILTFGFYRPWLDYKYICLITKRGLNK